jgi:stage II sporulation protein D
MRYRPLVSCSIFWAIVAALVAVGPATAAARYVAPAGSGALFVFNGHGWGHGVGMGQYGAYGYAQQGWTAPQILAHYYPGTTLEQAPVSQIRVLLADKKKTLKLGSDVNYTVRDGNGTTHRVDGGISELKVAQGLVLLGRQQLTPPLVFRASASSPLTLTRPYRGRIQVDVVDGKLRAINVVALEQYLYGVVPSEMPSAWAPEALKAQAVAARSYALATRQIGAPYDVFNDTRSQMYLGVGHEDPATSAAVDATKGQVLTYGGKIAYTYFFSTSGGRTESNANWGGTAVPYLVSVPDPYDTLSRYHDWGPVPVTGKTVVSALKIAGPATDMTTKLNSSGRVASVDVMSALIPTTVAGTKLRGALGLRSTWFDVGVLSLAGPVPNVPVVYGSTVQLTGAIRRVTGVTLEQRPSLSTWQTVSTVTPAADGSVRLTAKPTITTDYRIGTPELAAAFVRIRVSPLVSVTSAANGQVQGTVQPLLPDAPIQVQVQNADLTWSDVATGIVNADGTFAVPATITSGSTYRLVVTPGKGYAPATTPAQTMVR